MHLNAVQEVHKKDEVFLSRIFTVPKMERGKEYGKRFILNLKVSSLYTVRYYEYDRIVLNCILSCLYAICRRISFLYISIHMVIPLEYKELG